MLRERSTSTDPFGMWEHQTLRRLASLGGAEVGEHGEDSAVVVGGFGEVEFEKDLADVSFDGLGADEESLGDRPVGSAFGHQGEDFAFAVGELVER